jgi:pimeloyl-ACP methyl ester carboxylesterase
VGEDFSTGRGDPGEARLPLPVGMRGAVVKPARHVIYLHGFASSPASSKAQWFGRTFAEHGIAMSCPDLNLPEFETLTVTRMIGQAEAAIAAAAAGPVAFIGSSLGAFVALLAADRDRSGLVDRLVLLAPALDFGGNRLRDLGGHGIDEWRETGRLPVHHYAYGVTRDVGFALYEDASAYDAHALRVAVPALVFQGRHDASVDPAMVERWAASQPEVTLRLLDDNHQLTASLETMWVEIKTFLGLEPGAMRA